jgi:hypothetical protein
MKISQFKKILLTICMIGCLFVFLGILFSPSFVTNHLSPDVVSEEWKIKDIQNLRIGTICLGIFIILLCIPSSKWPLILHGASKLLDSKLILPALFLISFGYCLSLNRSYLNIYDEGITVYGAARIMQGEIPYRDFWAIYPPGQFYALALLFKFFGASIIVERIYSGIVSFLIVVFTYCLTRKLVSQKFALISWFLITLWIGGPFFFYSYPILPAIMFALISCLCLSEFIFKKRKWGLLLAGISTGVAVLFRHDIGFYTFLSETAVIIPFEYVSLSKNANNRAWRVFEGLQTWSKYLVGVIVVILPATGFLIYNVPVRELLSDLILFPAMTFPKYRSLPYPGPIPNPTGIIGGGQTIFNYAIETLGRVPFYFPPIVFAITLVGIMFSICNRRNLSEQKWLTILLFLLGVTFFNQAISRSDKIHLLPAITPTIILFPSLLSNIVRKDNIMSHFAIRSFLYFLALLVVLSFTLDSLKRIIKTGSILPLTTDLVSMDVNRARGIYLPAEQAGHLTKAVGYIQSCVPEEGKIFVGNSRHDRSFANDIMFYFLSERHSATKYHDLHPGLTTTRPIQREIIDELNRYGVNYIVLWSGLENVREPNKSGESSSISDLDDFIRNNYKNIIRFGPYTILKRCVGNTASQ